MKFYIHLRLKLLTLFPHSITCLPLQVPEGHVVMLSFRLFDMEADPTCRYDYLDIYNGHTRLVQKLGRFCGTFRPGAIIATSNTMMLEMVSDDSTGGRGFLAAFSAGKPHMEGGGRVIPQTSKDAVHEDEATLYPMIFWCLTAAPTSSRLVFLQICIVYKTIFLFTYPQKE